MKYVLVANDQNAGYSRDVEVANRIFENVAKFICIFWDDANKSKFAYMKKLR
jgi:hypothetical protein